MCIDLITLTTASIGSLAVGMTIGSCIYVLPLRRAFEQRDRAIQIADDLRVELRETRIVARGALDTAKGFGLELDKSNWISADLLVGLTQTQRDMAALAKQNQGAER